MASHKNHSDGISLLSVYGDEEDDEMENVDESPPRQHRHELILDERQQQLQQTLTPVHNAGVSAPDNCEFQERTPTRTTLRPPSTLQASPSQSFQQNNIQESDAANCTGHESRPVEGEEVVMATSEETKDVYPLENFLPPTPKCSEELQEKIKKFLTLKRIGRRYNTEVRNRKEYRNPDFLLRAVTYQDIDQIGSCFSKDVFDPHGYDKRDLYDEIEADMRPEMERKEQERKKSQKVDLIPGGTQPRTITPTPQISLPIPGLNTLPAAMDVLARDGRQKKKSKWDEVDGNQKNALSTGGQVLSAVAANAALLSAANAGAGHSAFAQQRRREAEEKERRSDRKLERRD